MYSFKNPIYLLLVLLIDAFGYLIALPFKLLSRKNQPLVPAKILVIRLDHIGDVISSIPVFENLKKHYPEAKLTLLVSGLAFDIVKNNPFIDEIIRYDAPWFSRSAKKSINLRRFLAVLSSLRKERFDLGIDLRGDFRQILMMFLAGVKYRASYGITGGGFLLNKKVGFRKGVHAVEHNLDILKALGVSIITMEPRIYSNEKEDKEVNGLLSEFKIASVDDVVIMHPSAGYPSKNWLDARFATLISVLTRDYAKKVILVGSDKDFALNEEIIKASGVSAVNAAGKTDLMALTGIIRRAELFIGVDSGPSHIASCENRPTVILYSGTNQAREWVPRGQNTIAIQKDLTCIGCQKLVCNHNKCMELISVEDVLAAAKSLLGQELKGR